MLKKEHYLALVDLQTKRWRLHIDLLDMYVEEDPSKPTEIQKATRELRHLNRKISELHEDWWGLSFQSDTYLRHLNTIDQTLEKVCQSIVQEESGLQQWEHLEQLHQQCIEFYVGDI
jgi:hypothetical protein